MIPNKVTSWPQLTTQGCCSESCCRCPRRASCRDRWRCSWSIQYKWVPKSGRPGSGARPSPNYHHMCNSCFRSMLCCSWRQRSWPMVVRWCRCKFFRPAWQHIRIQWNCKILCTWKYGAIIAYALCAYESYSNCQIVHRLIMLCYLLLGGVSIGIPDWACYEVLNLIWCGGRRDEGSVHDGSWGREKKRSIRVTQPQTSIVDQVYDLCHFK